MDTVGSTESWGVTDGGSCRVLAGTARTRHVGGECLEDRLHLEHGHPGVLAEDLRGDARDVRGSVAVARPLDVATFGPGQAHVDARRAELHRGLRVVVEEVRVLAFVG